MPTLAKIILLEFADGTETVSVVGSPKVMEAASLEIRAIL
jgi:hypothetical protein